MSQHVSIPADGSVVGFVDSNMGHDLETKQTTRYTGLCNIPNQLHITSLREGFALTVMVVGESGLGKSTLINSMFNAGVYRTEEEKKIPPTMHIESSTVKLEEKGVKLELTVIDTPGYGELIDNSGLIDHIVREVELRNSTHMENEGRVRRSTKRKDTRVHACLYVVQADLSGLKRLDVEFLLKMHKIVNIIIVVAKADTLKPSEMAAIKASIRADIDKYNIEVYIPHAAFDPKDDLEDVDILTYENHMPFAVFSSTYKVMVDGVETFGREYPWGTITVADEKISDHFRLRNMLVCTHMLDLIDRTNILYEQHRTDELIKLGVTNTTSLLREFKLKGSKLQEQLQAIEDMSHKLIENVQRNAAVQYDEAKALYSNSYNDLLELLSKEKEKLKAYEILNESSSRLVQSS
eukprot:CFRG6401T1